MDIYAGKDWIVIWCHNVRRGYDRVEGGIGRSYDDIKGVTMFVSRNFQMLGKITTGMKVDKLDCSSIAEVVDVEVVSNDEFMRGSGCVGKKRWELVKVEKGWEYGDGGGGR